jgi:hypothetical protein
MKMEKLKQDVKNYMLHGDRKPYMQYEQDKYSPYQNYLYKRVLYGLDALPSEEVLMMCSKKKQRIVNVYKRAQAIINRYKHQVTMVKTNALFATLFPKSEITKSLSESQDIDDNFKNKLTFKDLGITKDHLVQLFINEGVLPKNFLSLKEKV